MALNCQILLIFKFFGGFQLIRGVFLGKVKIQNFVDLFINIFNLLNIKETSF